MNPFLYVFFSAIVGTFCAQLVFFYVGIEQHVPTPGHGTVTVAEAQIQGMIILLMMGTFAAIGLVIIRAAYTWLMDKLTIVR